MSGRAAMGSALFDEGAFAPCPAPFNMAAHTFAAGLATPEKIALETLAGPGRVAGRWTHGALLGAVRSAAGGLVARGVRRGDRVLLRLGHTADFPILFFALNGIGAIPAPVSPLLTPGETATIAGDLAPSLIVVGAGVAPPPGSVAPVFGPSEIATLGDAAPHPFVDTSPDDPAFIVYTSGTTGGPKGVVHAQRAAWARRMMWDGWYGLTSDDRVLHAGAFNWTYTLGAGLTDPWAIGATALIHVGPPERGAWPALARAHGATIFAAAPGVYRQMLDADDAELAEGFAGLRHGLSAGEALAEGVRRRWCRATGKPILEALGMSEVSTYVSAAPEAPDGGLRPQVGRRVAILKDGTARPAMRGVAGDLAVSRRDPGLMLGYWRRDAETGAAIRGEWFVTGDRARMETDGAIVHLGRSDDLLNAGGYRVSPAEIEAALLARDDILDAAAIEMEVRPGVTVIAACYVPRDGAIEEAALTAHCARLLARYKQPRQFRPVEALPRSANGKLLRRKLKESLA